MSWDLATAERARSILNDLIRQRQGMRDAGVDEGLLEANRLGIVYWHLQLTRRTAEVGGKPPNPLMGGSQATRSAGGTPPRNRHR